MTSEERAMAWEIVRAPDDDAHVIEEVRELFREYHAWLGEVVCSRRLSEEIADLPGPYAAPAGRLFLARTRAAEGVPEEGAPVVRAAAAGTALGCVGVRPHHADACEVKRLYVTREARGTGLGRALLETALAAAREIGYREALVTTLPDAMPTAREMYLRHGFEPTAPFVDHSHVDEGVRLEYLRLEL